MKQAIKNQLNCGYAPVLFLMLSGLLGISSVYGQSNGFPNADNKNESDNHPKSVKEFLAKQRLEKAKKDHEELLKRGEELQLLTRQLEAGFEKNNRLTAGDQEKLESVEKLVTKIRKGLGGDGDEEEPEAEPAAAENEPQPNTLKEAFVALKERTARLIDELKKTSRFTISAVAIQSSNSVLKVIRFLRLRK